MKSDVSPAKQLTAFLARFSPDIVKLAKAARARVRKRLPGAIEMVYDNYNALVIGYSPTDRPSDAILSIVIWPKRVSVCFLQGRHLPDPEGLLHGDGNQVRFVRLDAGAAILDSPAMRALVSEASAFGGTPFRGAGRVVIRGVTKKQRPRR
jgi:hypothetical protein